MLFLLMFMDNEWRFNFCFVYLLMFVPYQVRFSPVAETPTLPQVVFNSLINILKRPFYSLRFVWEGLAKL